MAKVLLGQTVTVNGDGRGLVLARAEYLTGHIEVLVMVEGFPLSRRGTQTIEWYAESRVTPLDDVAGSDAEGV